MCIKVFEKSWFRLVFSSHYSAHTKRSHSEMEADERIFAKLKLGWWKELCWKYY